MDVEIENVEKTISSFPWLTPPGHVYILDAPLLFQGKRCLLLVSGATPIGENIIILTPQADEKTILEEVFHTFGLHEPGAKLLSRLSLIKLNWLPNIRRQNVKYVEAECSVEALEQLGIKGAPFGTPRHYELQRG